MTARAILIIDDDEVDRKTIWRNLCFAKWEGEIVQASDATEGLRQVATRSFDCILLDYNLPGIDGLELMAKLGTCIPIIMLTGEGNEMVAVQALKLGAADYLPKSLLSQNNLVRILTHAIEKQQLRLELAQTQSRLAHQALYDTATDLGNRRLFQRDLDRMIGLAQRHGYLFYLMLLQTNYPDTQPHDSDLTRHAVLAEMGRRFIGSGRSTDSFYRIADLEFAALVDVPDSTAMKIAVQRLVERIARPVALGSKVLQIEAHLGLALFKEGIGAAQLLQQAEAALRTAKQDGAAFVFAETA